MKKIEIDGISIQELKCLLQEVVREELNARTPASNEMKEELLTREETAKLLKISLVTLNCWTKAQRIRSYRIGSRIYYKDKDIQMALKEVKFSFNRKTTLS